MSDDGAAGRLIDKADEMTADLARWCASEHPNNFHKALATFGTIVSSLVEDYCRCGGESNAEALSLFEAFCEATKKNLIAPAYENDDGETLN